MNIRIIILKLVVFFAGCTQQPQKSSQELIEHCTGINDKLLTPLLNELNTVIQENDIREAVNYFSVNAVPITQKNAKKEQVELSRVSHRNRNRLNAANKNESNLIEKFITQLKDGETLSPIIISENKQKIYYSPILPGAPLCLNVL